jgi:nicotinamidase-related amidase
MRGTSITQHCRHFGSVVLWVTGHVLSAELLREWRGGKSMADFPVVPERLALVNVDMQNCFVEVAADGYAVLERINRLAAVCREVGILVVHARHVLRPDKSNVGVFGEIFPWESLTKLLPDDERGALHQGVVVDPRDLLLEKPRFGAFHATDLELLLRTRGVDTIMITGIQTNICCDTTAREAMAREFRVFFLSDGTATSDDDEISAAELQKATLYSIGAFSQVQTVDEMIEKIRDAARAEQRASEHDLRTQPV